MATDSATLRRRIRQIMPDLEIRQFEVNDEGLINDVVIVNEHIVFRFAKYEEYADELEGELKILELVQSTVGVRVPTPLLAGPGYIVYPLLAGEPLLGERITALDEVAQRCIAEDLGSFLFRLHTIDISQRDLDLPSTLAPVTRERWLDIYSRIKKTVYPLLWKHQVAWAEQLFNRMLADPLSFDFKPTLIHGDLRPYHILIDSQTNEITGVIDFGVAGIGDPALDIGTLINTYGESFVAKMMKSYPSLDELLPRARFYAQSIEPHWVLLGIETGDHFWFSAHLACARDVRV